MRPYTAAHPPRNPRRFSPFAIQWQSGEKNTMDRKWQRTQCRLQDKAHLDDLEFCNTEPLLMQRGFREGRVLLIRYLILSDIN